MNFPAKNIFHSIQSPLPPTGRGLTSGASRGLRSVGNPTLLVHRALLNRDIRQQFKCGRGSAIIRRKVRIGKGVTIGKNTDIAAEEIAISDGVPLGSNATIRCRRLVLKNNSRIDSHSRLYGIRAPNSTFESRANGWVYPHFAPTPGERISTGDRTATGSHHLIFSRSPYLPITHGYPVKIAPGETGSDTWFPWYAFILPRTIIDDGATVGAFSLMSGEAPVNSLAIGVPAKNV